VPGGKDSNDPAILTTLLQAFEIVDLSQTLEEGIPSWPTHARFGQVLYESYELGDIARHYGLTLSEHTGTHMDAPLHFMQRGPAHYGIDKVPLDRLAGRTALIEAPELPRGGILTAAHVREWEEEHGPIEERNMVLIRYGWDRKWGIGPKGKGFLENWPGLGGNAAEYLVEKEVSLVSCDTLAVDAFGSEENPAHYALLGNEVYIVENLKNLDKLPPWSFFMAFPLKVKGGSGSPVRAVTLVHREGQWRS
jgi:kynurenine formamidase